ncbi:MAG: ABC transporter permease [Anaerolineae bacterium]|nr:ABC transporter permease [Anaerolineae bacterium]
MSWQKIWLVLRREYVTNFRRPAFLFTAFGVPLLSLGAMFLITRLTVDRETNLDSWQQIGYIDQAGVIDPAGPNPDNYQPVVKPDQTPPERTEEGVLVGPYYEELEAYARQQVLDGALDAYFVISSHYPLTGQVDFYTDRSSPEALVENIEYFMSQQIAAKAPDSLPVPVARLHDTDFTIRDVDSGDEVSDAAMIGRVLLPFIFVMLYFMATNTTAQFLMSGVVEEKENRLMEILATSLRPIELLWGKLSGLGALALTQVVLWSVGGVVVALMNADARDFLTGTEFRATDVALMLMLFLINFVLFSAMMLGIGASVTAETESRQIAGLFTFLNVLPLVLAGMFVSNPNGPLPVFLTFFPLTAAVSVIMRMGFGSLPVWQLALSAAIQVVSVVVVMWLAAKVFRLGMLMYGKPLTPRALWAALREGRGVMTTASTEYEPAVSAQPTKKGWFGR